MDLEAINSGADAKRFSADAISVELQKAFTPGEHLRVSVANNALTARMRPSGSILYPSSSTFIMLSSSYIPPEIVGRGPTLSLIVDSNYYNVTMYQYVSLSFYTFSAVTARTGEALFSRIVASGGGAEDAAAASPEGTPPKGLFITNNRVYVRVTPAAIVAPPRAAKIYFWPFTVQSLTPDQPADPNLRLSGYSLAINRNTVLVTGTQQTTADGGGATARITPDFSAPVFLYAPLTENATVECSGNVIDMPMDRASIDVSITSPNPLASLRVAVEGNRIVSRAHLASPAAAANFDEGQPDAYGVLDGAAVRIHFGGGAGPTDGSSIAVRRNSIAAAMSAVGAAAATAPGDLSFVPTGIVVAAPSLSATDVDISLNKVAALQRPAQATAPAVFAGIRLLAPPSSTAPLASCTML